ncbi:MAG: DUF4082 domain-containing protein [Thermoanaerobaculia bacterium]
MRKLLLTVALLLVFAGAATPGVEAQTWTIFTTQTPTETLDASPGWEVGTRFTTSKPGKVIGFRFWRAVGETGTNYGKLWNNSGTRLKMSNAFPSGTGWVTVYLNTPVIISTNTVYRVSVNTNTKQVKKGGAYVFDGHITNGPLFSDSGYYGQPLNAMPTAESASYFFVDVIFQEDVPPPPKPDLVISDINPFSGTKVVMKVCNVGNADAGQSYTRLHHWVAPLPTGQGWVQTFVDVYTNPIPAGQCGYPELNDPSAVGYHHEYTVDADSQNQVSESNETNNRAKLTWDRWQ